MAKRKSSVLHDYEIQQYDFQIKFGGENEISLSSLGKSLMSINNLLNEAAKQKCDLKVNVKSVSSGSFVIDLSAVAYVATNLFTVDNINYIKTALITVKEWVDIKKHLSGEKPKKLESNENGKIQVTNAKGDVIMNSNDGAKFFENSAISNSIVNVFVGVSDGARNSLQIIEKDGNTLLGVEEKDYEVLKKNSDNVPESNVLISYTTTDLLIQKPDLIGNSKWVFYFNKIIAAKIEDESWLESFRAHKQSLKSGAQMKVYMRMETTRDKNGNPIDNTTRYYVERVISVINPFDVDENQTAI